jgi:hypothetical protein
MVRQTGSEVRYGEDGLMGAELAEKEIERHRLVGDSGLNGWGGEGLHLHGKRAMADANGDIRRRSGGAVLSGGWGSHGGVGKTLIGEYHVKLKTVKNRKTAKRCLRLGVGKVTRIERITVCTIVSGKEFERCRAIRNATAGLC